MSRLDFQGRHRTLLFMGGHGAYLVLVSLFPLVLPYAIGQAGDLSRLLILVNVIVLMMDAGSLGLSRGLQQLAIETPSERLPRRMARPMAGALLFAGAVIVALAALTPLLFAWHPGWFDGSPWAAALVWLNAALGLLRLVSQSLLYGWRRYDWMVGLDVAWAAARLVLVPLAWITGGIYLTLIVMAALWLGSLVPAALVLRRAGLRVSADWRRGVRTLAYYLRFGFWLQAAYLAGNMIRPLAVLTIAWAVGHTAQAPHAAPGFAHLALSIFVIGATLMDATLMALYPEKAQAGREGQDEALGRRARDEGHALLWVLAPLALAGWGLSPLLAHVWPAQYHDLGPWVGVMVLALPARGIATPLLMALQARHRPRSAAAWQCVRLVIVLAGLAAGLVYAGDALRGGSGLTANARALAPLWGIVAGEWLATLILLMAQRGAAALTVGTVTLLSLLAAWAWTLHAMPPGAGFWATFGIGLLLWLIAPPLAGWVRPRVLRGMMFPAGRAALLTAEE